MYVLHTTSPVFEDYYVNICKKIVQVWAFENQITREWGTVRPLRKDLRACQSPTLDIYELQIATEIFPDTGC